jgi:hypothetical protein
MLALVFPSLRGEGAAGGRVVHGGRDAPDNAARAFPGASVHHLDGAIDRGFTRLSARGLSQWHFEPSGVASARPALARVSRL